VSRLQIYAAKVEREREREREMACSVSALFFVELLFVIVHAMQMQSGCGVQSGTGVW
jgi:hypothetical protein